VVIAAAAAVLGGLGLFLLGMRLMTDGLRLSAGRTLTRILERSTGTPLRGLLSGAALTAVVQSSSAVTVATIGFVNAGVVGLRQALSVVYGSNLGTTMTGWLVALVGFHVNVRAFALPAIGLGALLRLLEGRRRVAHLGTALAGFGVFFLGIDVLKGAFLGIGQGLPLDFLTRGGVAAVLLSVVAGFFLTFLVQSSSAAMALILTAAGGGSLPLDVAAGAVIGANVGTTSTAALSVLGATPNAKRVAAGHIAFNAVTGAVALAILPAMLFALTHLGSTLHLGTGAAVLLALFHTAFNLLGVAIFWPLSRPLVRVLDRLFRSVEEDEARPRFLDRNVVATPALAMRALVLELERVGELARRAARTALGPGPPPSRPVAADRSAVEGLVEAVVEFVNALVRGTVSGDVAQSLPEALRIARHDAEVAELASSLAAGRQEQAPIELEELRAEERRYLDAVCRLLDGLSSAAAPGFSPGRAAAELEAEDAQYHALKAHLLQAGARGDVGVRTLAAHLDTLSDVRRLAKQAERAATRLAAFAAEPRSDAETAAAGAGVEAGPG
jgi:phosphate:Na+ symporter